MSLFFGASLLIALITGLLLTWILVPPERGQTAGLPLRLFVGGGLGIGVTSCSYFLCLLTGLTRYVAAVDLFICLGLGGVWLWRRGKRRIGNGAFPPAALPPADRRAGITGMGDRQAPGNLPFRRPARRGSPFATPVALVFPIALAAFLISFLIAFLKEPHGRWDAWLIWNMHARFLFRGGELWREAFASGLDWSHWDYPLLLPLSIARGWAYAGGEGVLSPAAMGFAFTCLILGLLCGSLALLRGRTPGFLAAMVLMGTPFFITMGASQFADIPFAFFVLAAFVMLFGAGRSPGNAAGPLVLAGLAAGLGAWTKNEGLLFALIVTLSTAGLAWHSGGWREALRRTGWFLAGALPVLLLVLYFKLRLAPTNDIMAGVGLAAISAKLLDWGRYAEIARAFFFTGISFTQGVIDVREGMRFNPGAVSILLLVAYLFIGGIRIDPKERGLFFLAATVLALTLTGYFFVYVLTPLDLNWHLVTSLNRLFLQLWPSAVFLVFMAAAVPGEDPPEGRPAPAPPAAIRPPAKGKSKRPRS